MTNDTLIHQALHRVALFAEMHSIKGVLAVRYLCDSVPMSGESFFRECLDWDQVLNAPKVSGLIHPTIDFPSAALSDGKLVSLIEESVFPMAYVAGATWVARHGIAHLIRHFRQRAIQRIGYLGHAWTIWCSFWEVLPQLRGDEQQLLAMERFVEFVASQLSSPEWLRNDEAVVEAEETTALIALTNAEFLKRICQKPGFLGHTLITYSYLLKYQNDLCSRRMGSRLP